MEEPLVSIILPVYNVQKYLEKAIISVSNQSYKNIEIIIINDGSTDDSLKVANNIVKNFKNIFVFSKKNGGAGTARNQGILKARGKYLYFLDPDDWIKENYISEMVKMAERFNSELVISGFTNLFYRKNKEIKIPVSVRSQNYKDLCSFRNDAVIYLNNTMLAVPWNKLYLTDFIKKNNLTFPKVKWDDLHFNLEVIKKVSHVSILNNIDYQFYRNRPGSETSNIFNGKLFENRKKQFIHVLDVFSNWNLRKKSMDMVYYYFCSRIVEVIQEIVSENNFSMREKKSLLKEVLNDELVINAVKHQSGGSLPMKIMIQFLKTNNLNLILLVNFVLIYIKNNFSTLFLKAKAKSMKV